MDGTIAQLNRMRALCDQYGALLGIDECHATGFMGARGRGTHEHRGVFGKVDIITGTLGKALGGASGGFTAARREVVELLRQRSRPYLFSNTLMPAIAGASLAVLDLLEGSTALRDKLEDNTRWFRDGIVKAGFDIKPGTHPIVPIMVYDAIKAQQLSARLLELGVYAVGFFFPVVPKGQARIRVQMSAVHEREHLERAVAAFAQAGRELGPHGHMTAPKTLIIGANGQIGTELAEALAERHGTDAVVTSDLAPTGRVQRLAHEALDVTDAAALAAVVARHRIERIVLLAAALSANGEKHPQWAWNLNMGGLLNVLELARSVSSSRCSGRAASRPSGQPRRAPPRSTR